MDTGRYFGIKFRLPFNDKGIELLTGVTFDEEQYFCSEHENPVSDKELSIHLLLISVHVFWGSGCVG